jgi:hypothetical protein
MSGGLLAFLSEVRQRAVIVFSELLLDEVSKNIVIRGEVVPQALTRLLQRLVVEGIVDTGRLFWRVDKFGQSDSLSKVALEVAAIADQAAHDLEVMMRETRVLPVPAATVLFTVVAPGQYLPVSSFEIVAAVNDMAAVNTVTGPFLRVNLLGHMTLL